MKVSQPLTSLEEHIGKEGDSELGDMIIDQTAEDPEAIAINLVHSEKIKVRKHRYAEILNDQEHGNE